MINNIYNEKDFEKLLENSRERPVFLFKHSTTCGLSAAAWQEYSSVAEVDNRADFWRILVRENRPISLIVAKKTGIEHQSPQVILFYHGHAIWHISHLEISSAVLKNKLDTVN
jgi:bacillithiol system protein YtxJ